MTSRNTWRAEYMTGVSYDTFGSSYDDSWFEVTNDSACFRTDNEEDAEWLASFLNVYEQATSNN